MTDRHWMRRALVLARRGWGLTSPNPLVGAVVLDSNGRLAGTGFHRKAGEEHAEVAALGAAGARARGGSLFCTLEPCCWFEGKRTPGCAELVIRSGIRRVVAASLDPNPHVSGRGVAQIQEAGIDVSVGCLGDISDFLNAPYRTFVLKRRPLVTGKVAVTDDGKIGVRGKRVHLSGKECLRRTMHLRAQAGAILVGSKTVLNDDPLLTVRGRFADRRPVRAVLDPDLETPSSARLFSTEGGPVWIFTAEGRSSRALEAQGARILPILSLPEILKTFAETGVTAVLVEGGAETLSHFGRAGLVDRWVIYRTNHRLGAVHQGFPTVSFDPLEAFAPQVRQITRRGDDREIVAVAS